MANNPYNNKVQLADGTVLIDLTGTTATADKILQGYGAYGADGSWMDGTAVAGAGSAIVVTDTLDEHGGTIRNINAVSLDGDTVRPDVLLSGYTAHNSLGEAIVGTASGGGSPTLQAKTHIEPTESSQTITADTGYDGLSSVQIDPIDSEYVGSDVTRRSSSDLTASGATVTVPAGYYASQASKSVASGSAGTPSATKGTVSNHSVSVTPSVTNTTGYISGGTKTGTAVTVSASELVSGSQTLSSNDTYDVTNLASVVVDVPSSSPNLQAKTNIAPSISSQTIRPDSGYDGLSSVQINAMPSGTAGTPSASKGTVSNHSVSVTPSVTNTTGYITGSTKTGTAVTVSASELVSGSETKTANGTYDVTNLAELVVNVSGGGGSSMNVQVAQSTTRIANTAYTKACSLTCTKTGTYDVYAGKDSLNKNTVVDTGLDVEVGVEPFTDDVN